MAQQYKSYKRLETVVQSDRYHGTQTVQMNTTETGFKGSTVPRSIYLGGVLGPTVNPLLVARIVKIKIKI